MALMKTSNPALSANTFRLPYADAGETMTINGAVNKTGIGPEGFGGKVTAMAVHVESFPCHIASLPVAVNINCHAARHKTIIL